MRRRLRDLPPAVVAWLAVYGLRIIARMPTFVLIAKLASVRWCLKRIDRQHPALAPLDEVLDLLRHDKKATRAIKRMLSENRRRQAFSFFRGFLRHRLGRPLPPPPPVQPRRRVPAPKRVAVLGDNLDAKLLHAAYGGNLADWTSADDLAGLDGLEITDPRRADIELVRHALQLGTAVSLHHALLTSAEQARSLFSTAGIAGTPLRLFYPYWFYPPAQRVNELLAGGAIGEVRSIRVRATLGATGGTLPPEPLPADQPLFHPAFDHCLLLAWWGGAPAAVTAYQQPFDPQRGGQALVNVRYACGGRYGLLDCTYAPELYLRSEFYPYDLDAEVAGTDGIVWLRRGMAQRVVEPAVFLRAGKIALSLGLESGLDDDWSAAHRAAAADFLAQLNGQTVPVMDQPTLLAALSLREKTAAAAQSPVVLKI